MSYSPNDFLMTPESCAKEIMENVAQALVSNTDPDIFQHACENAEKVIQCLLSSEVAAVHAQYQALAVQWRKPGMYFGIGREYEAAVEGAYKGCASAVEALEGRQNPTP